MGMEDGGGEKLWKWWVFTCVEVDTARRSHLRPIQALDITNSSQFDGKAFLQAVWRFPAGWVPVQSHYCHLKITQALEHARQAPETSPRKAHQITIGNNIVSSLM